MYSCTINPPSLQVVQTTRRLLEKLYEKTTDSAQLKDMTEVIIENNALFLMENLDHDNKDVSTVTVQSSPVFYASVFIHIFKLYTI